MGGFFRFRIRLQRGAVFQGSIRQSNRIRLWNMGKSLWMSYRLVTCRIGNHRSYLGHDCSLNAGSRVQRSRPENILLLASLEVLL